MDEAAQTPATPRAAPVVWRRWGRIALGALIVLVLAELGVRALAPRLPEPRTWQSVEAQQKVEQMDALARRGGVDLAFVGSSVVNAGIDPAVASRRLGGDVTAFNASLSAGGPPVMEPWTVEVVLPRLRPKVLILGVTSFDFYDSAAGEEFYDGLADSASGARALGVEGVGKKLERWLGDVLYLWRYRVQLQEPRTVLDAIRDDTDEPVGEYGPVIPGGQVIVPQERKGNNPKELGPPVDNWTLGRESPALIARLIEEAKRHGATVVLVDMPITQAYVDRHPRGEADYLRYLGALRRLGRRGGVLVLEHNSIRDPSRFIDQVHMRIEGGRAFTSQLIDELEAEGVLRTRSR